MVNGIYRALCLCTVLTLCFGASAATAQNFNFFKPDVYFSMTQGTFPGNSTNSLHAEIGPIYTGRTVGWGPYSVYIWQEGTPHIQVRDRYGQPQDAFQVPGNMKKMFAFDADNDGAEEMIAVFEDPSIGIRAVSMIKPDGSIVPYDVSTITNGWAHNVIGLKNVSNGQNGLLIFSAPAGQARSMETLVKVGTGAATQIYQRGGLPGTFGDLVTQHNPSGSGCNGNGSSFNALYDDGTGNIVLTVMSAVHTHGYHGINLGAIEPVDLVPVSGVNSGCIDIATLTRDSTGTLNTRIFDGGRFRNNYQLSVPHLSMPGSSAKLVRAKLGLDQNDMLAICREEPGSNRAKVHYIRTYYTPGNIDVGNMQYSFAPGSDCTSLASAELTGDTFEDLLVASTNGVHFAAYNGRVWSGRPSTNTIGGPFEITPPLPNPHHALDLNYNYATGEIIVGGPALAHTANLGVTQVRIMVGTESAGVSLPAGIRYIPNSEDIFVGLDGSTQLGSYLVQSRLQSNGERVATQSLSFTEPAHTGGMPTMATVVMQAVVIYIDGLGRRWMWLSNAQRLTTAVDF